MSTLPPGLKPWEPQEQLLGLILRILEGFCAIWPKEDTQFELLRQITEARLSFIWQLIHNLMPVGHKHICARVFWDRVAACYPGRGVYEVVAWYGPDLNSDNSAKKVLLQLRAEHVAMVISFNVNA